MVLGASDLVFNCNKAQRGCNVHWCGCCGSVEEKILLFVSFQMLFFCMTHVFFAHGFACVVLA